MSSPAGSSRDRKSWVRFLEPGLSALFVALFAVEAFAVSKAAARLARLDDALEDRGRALAVAAAGVEALVRRTNDESHEMEFLQDLPNLLPQDKGYLRTQKVLADDVRALRAKLSGRLRGSLYVLVDAKADKLYLKKGMKLLWQADCSVGRGGMLRDKATGRRWEFVTPRGEFRVLSKAENPLWRKPDWAYVEEGDKRIPPPDDPSRYVAGELGAYLLNLGDGYLIHGTKDEALLGRPASHGCVRLGAEDLKKLYAAVPVGTKVFIFY